MNPELATATEHCETCGRPIAFDRPLNAELVESPTPATADNPQLPSVADFLRAWQAYLGYASRTIMLPTCWIAVGCMALVAAVLWYRTSDQVIPLPARYFVAWLAVGASISPPLLYAAVALWRWRRPALLTCLHCHKPLMRLRQIVVASRHCGHCGKRVLRQEEVL